MLKVKKLRRKGLSWRFEGVRTTNHAMISLLPYEGHQKKERFRVVQLGISKVSS